MTYEAKGQAFYTMTHRLHCLLVVLLETRFVSNKSLTQWRPFRFGAVHVLSLHQNRLQIVGSVPSGVSRVVARAILFVVTRAWSRSMNLVSFSFVDSRARSRSMNLDSFSFVDSRSRSSILV